MVAGPRRHHPPASALSWPTRSGERQGYGGALYGKGLHKQDAEAPPPPLPSGFHPQASPSARLHLSSPCPPPSHRKLLEWLGLGVGLGQRGRWGCGGDGPGNLSGVSLAPSPACPPPTHLKFLQTKLRASVTVATGLLRNGWVSFSSTKSVHMAASSLSNGLPLSWRHPSWGWVPGRENKAIKIPKRGGKEAWVRAGLRPRGVGGVDREEWGPVPSATTVPHHAGSLGPFRGPLQRF